MNMPHWQRKTCGSCRRRLSSSHFTTLEEVTTSTNAVRNLRSHPLRTHTAICRSYGAVNHAKANKQRTDWLATSDDVYIDPYGLRFERSRYFFKSGRAVWDRCITRLGA